MPKPPKDYQLKIRVTGAMKDQLDQIVNDRGESLAVIAREALTLYLKTKYVQSVGTELRVAETQSTHSPGSADALLNEELGRRAAAKRANDASSS